VGGGAYNYRSEPAGYRFPADFKGDWSPLFSNSLTNGLDPQTPVFHAAVGTPVRFRLLFPGGDFFFAINIHGHNWQELPWVDRSTRIGDNRLSQTLGSVTIVNDQPVDIVLPSAGGEGQVVGDYLYGPTVAAGGLGTWGLLRVSQNLVAIHRADTDAFDRGATISGIVMAQGGARADAIEYVTIERSGEEGKRERLGVAAVDSVTGAWTFEAPAGSVAAGDVVVASTTDGGSYKTTVREAHDVAQPPVPTATGGL
jgi:hypothetical protein